MNLDAIVEYAGNFLQSAVDFISGPLGVVVLGVGICPVIVYFFEDLRR